MVIVDTTVWIDYFRGRSTPETDWLEEAVARERLGLVDLILCEILQGFDRNADFAAASRELSAFEILETGGSAIALAAAHNYRFLRTRGRTVRKTIDCIIATFCLAHDHQLLHRDRDFDAFEALLGLSVVHP